MPSITFTAATLRELEQQIVDFLGVSPAAPTAAPSAPAAGRPIPVWAPAGAFWSPMPGAPVLIGPDGAVIPVRWDGSTPRMGEVIVNHDADAEAAGDALLHSLRGGG